MSTTSPGPAGSTEMFPSDDRRLYPGRAVVVAGEPISRRERLPSVLARRVVRTGAQRRLEPAHVARDLDRAEARQEAGLD